jgi:DNA-binding response OmpR family regulator
MENHMRDGHVLIVEDDQDLAEALQLVLESQGYETARAGNGREALDAIAAHMPALIMLDMSMPIMDGWQFAREFESRHGRSAPIVVISAAEKARERAAEIGADDVIPKPFNISDVVERVERLVGRPR